jgi:hypothetical protein
LEYYRNKINQNSKPNYEKLVKINGQLFTKNQAIFHPVFFIDIKDYEDQKSNQLNFSQEYF